MLDMIYITICQYERRHTLFWTILEVEQWSFGSSEQLEKLPRKMWNQRSFGLLLRSGMLHHVSNCCFLPWLYVARLDFEAWNSSFLPGNHGLRKALWLAGQVPDWPADELPVAIHGFHEDWRGESGYGEFRRVEGFSMYVDRNDAWIEESKFVTVNASPTKRHVWRLTIYQYIPTIHPAFLSSQLQNLTLTWPSFFSNPTFCCRVLVLFSHLFGPNTNIKIVRTLRCRSTSWSWQIPSRRTLWTWSSAGPSRWAARPWWWWHGRVRCIARRANWSGCHGEPTGKNEKWVRNEEMSEFSCTFYFFSWFMSNVRLL